jgi:hypothetical protein
MRAYAVANRQATRWLRGGLVVVWGVVGWRAGPTAIGYSLRAFEADLQSLLSTAPIHTVPLRHPYGGVVELTAEELRSAYWIAPHLDWAGLCFVQGAWLSIVIWLGSLAYLGRQRSEADPQFRVRIDRALDQFEAGVAGAVNGMLRLGSVAVVGARSKVLRRQGRGQGYAPLPPEVLVEATEPLEPAAEPPRPSPRTEVIQTDTTKAPNQTVPERSEHEGEGMSADLAPPLPESASKEVAPKPELGHLPSFFTRF